MWALTDAELERARNSKPLPLDASWATGDEKFDARIHASLLRIAELEAKVAARDAALEAVRIELRSIAVEREDGVLDFVPALVARSVSVAERLGHALLVVSPPKRDVEHADEASLP